MTNLGKTSTGSMSNNCLLRDYQPPPYLLETEERHTIAEWAGFKRTKVDLCYYRRNAIAAVLTALRKEGVL